MRKKQSLLRAVLCSGNFLSGIVTKPDTSEALIAPALPVFSFFRNAHAGNSGQSVNAFSVSCLWGNSLQGLCVLCFSRSVEEMLRGG